MDTTRLAEFPLFEGLDDDALTALLKSGHELSVQEGAELVREGDYSYDLTVIEEGQAEVMNEGQVIATLGPGDVFGETGLLAKELRNASVIAGTDMRLIKLTSFDVNRLRGQYPDLVKRIEDLAASRAPS